MSERRPASARSQAIGSTVENWVRFAAFATKDCYQFLFYQKDRGLRGLAAQRRDARIGPACAVRAARVGPPQRIVQVLETASTPRLRCLCPGELHQLH